MAEYVTREEFTKAVTGWEEWKTSVETALRKRQRGPRKPKDPAAAKKPKGGGVKKPRKPKDPTAPKKKGKKAKKSDDTSAVPSPSEADQ